MARLSGKGRLSFVLVAAFVLAACGSGATTPPDGVEYPEFPDLSGSWTASLSEGRFYDHGDGVWSVGSCSVEGLGLTLQQGSAYFISSRRREAPLTGSHSSAAMICGGDFDPGTPAPFAGDTTLVIPEGPLDGAVREECLEPGGFTGLSGCDAAPEFVLELSLPDVAPVSSQGVHFHLWLHALRPTSSSIAGTFDLQAFEYIGTEGASSSLVMEGSLTVVR